MASNWQTFPVSFTEGELTNLPLLEQGINAPGSAQTLLNLEVSAEGGYRSIKGYVKYDTAAVPPFGQVFVLGSDQTGNTLVVSNTSLQITEGVTFQINGSGQEYTVVSSSFSGINRTNTLLITPSIVSAPPDKSVCTFTSAEGPRIEGVAVLASGGVIAKRGGAIWYSEGAGWVYTSVPNYGSPLVSIGPHTTTEITLKNLDKGPIQTGDCFTVNGFDGTFTVLTSTPLVGGECTITFSPSLSLAPVENTVVTFVGAGLKHGTGKLKTAVYRFSDECKAGCVDGVNKPFSVGCTSHSFEWLTNAPSDIVGAHSIATVRNSLFFLKNSWLVFTAPATENDFDTGNGAGVINVGSQTVAATPFKDNLIVFSTNKIDILRGSSSSDFQFTSLSNKTGCVSGDTPIEVGGDVLYLAPDGIRFLSDTERSGDFGVDIASDKIKTKVSQFINRHQNFQSVLIRDKNQYRLFGYKESVDSKFCVGICGTQFGGQGVNDIRWSELQGFKVFNAHSFFLDGGELTVFSNDTPYIYRMEVGQTFDGEPIPWTYRSPWWSISDPSTRKAFYKANIYTRLKGSFHANFNLQLDFNESTVVDPWTLVVEDQNSQFSYYGDSTAIFGVARFGVTPQTLFSVPTVGNAHVFSVKLHNNSIENEFTLDNIVVEYGQKGRN